MVFFRLLSTFIRIHCAKPDGYGTRWPSLTLLQSGGYPNYFKYHHYQGLIMKGSVNSLESSVPGNVRTSNKNRYQIRSILILNSILQQYVLCDTHCSLDILRNVSFPFEAFRLFFQARTLNTYLIILSELVIENLKIFGLYSNIVCCPIYVCWSFYVEISKHVWRSWHRTVRKMNFDYWECWMKSFKGQMRSLVIGMSLCTLFAIH